MESSLSSARVTSSSLSRPDQFNRRGQFNPLDRPPWAHRLVRLSRRALRPNRLYHQLHHPSPHRREIVGRCN